MKHYESTVTIDAPPERVWSVLSEGNAWPSWDSGVLKVEGDFRPGNKVKLTSEANPKRAFPIKVAEMDAPRRIVLSGGMPLGLFKGVRTYTLTPEGGSTRFHMREEYTGPMLNMIWKSMPDLQPSFDKFTHGLKRKVEGG